MALLKQARELLVMSEVVRAPDKSLVARASRGDRRAIGEIYERYWRMVHGAVLARVPCQDVEDIVQDVFTAAVRRLPTLREGDALGGWLLAIARNRAADYHRRARKTTELPEDLGRNDPPTAEAKQALEKIRGLPEAFRETLIMRFVCGMTGPEIAELTDMTPGSVRVNLHRGMALLREALGAEDV